MAENFPGEFGSEQLVQQVVDMILAATERKEKLEQVEHEKHQVPTDSSELCTYWTILDHRPVHVLTNIVLH